MVHGKEGGMQGSPLKEAQSAGIKSMYPQAIAPILPPDEKTLLEN